MRVPPLKESQGEQVCQALPEGNSVAVAELSQMCKECLASMRWPEALLLMGFQGAKSKSAEQKPCS